MAKNNKYLQYAKSRNKIEPIIDLRQVALEFGKLLDKKFCYVFSGGIRVEFQFKMENFYHLLGFHKLTDVTIIKMVEQHKLKKEEFFKLVRAGNVSMDTTDVDGVEDFEEKIVHIQDTERKSDFGDIKANRFQFFSEENVLELLLCDPVIDFNKDKCNTEIDADKVFFKLITDKGRNLNLFIGYDEEENNHYTATFFLEKEKNKYLMKKSGELQSQLEILSRVVIDTRNNEMVDFYVKWENVRDEFVNEPYYKGQSKLKTWIKSKHISSKQVIEEIKIQRELQEQYIKEVEALTLTYTILNAVSKLEVESEKEVAQLELMEYDIDAENEDEIAEYQSMDVTQIKSDKIRMENKLAAIENKLRFHEKHLPDVIELEQQEVILVYQEYIEELKLDKEKIRKVLDFNEVFANKIFPDRFFDIYKSVL